MTTEEWLRSNIESKKNFIRSLYMDIEKARVRIEVAERELASYEEDLKKFKSVK